MSEKVKLPKEVAEAIEHYREKGMGNASIIAAAVTNGSGAKHPRNLVNFVLEHVDNSDRLMSALVNGYEVEQTPEENLCEYFKQAVEDAESDDYELRVSGIEREGAITHTLRLLGIKIEGINA